MEKITGTYIDGRSRPQFTWNADLIAFDGPLLSLFRREDGKDSLFVWVDCNHRYHRWAIIDISRADLSQYLAQRITLLDAFKASNSVIVFDQSKRGTRNYIETVWTELPETYLPADESYLTDDIATEDARKLANDTTESYTIKLDGELFIDDLAGFPRLYQQLYSFHYGLEHLVREAVRNTISSHVGRWKGGFSAVNLFNGLQNVTPSIHRAKINRMHYASPGEIQLDLLPAMAEKIRRTAAKINDDNTFPDAEELYREIYKYFRNNKISGFEDEKAYDKVQLSDTQITELKSYVNQYIELFEWHSYKGQFTSLDIGPLAQLRTLLAYYRRLRKLLNYQRLGQIELT